MSEKDFFSSQLSAPEPPETPFDTAEPEEPWRTSTEYQGPPLEVERELISRVQKGYAEAKEALLERYFFIVQECVYEDFSEITWEREDLKQVGRLALLEAAEKFDPTVVKWFVTYARTIVRGRMLTYLNTLSKDIVLPAHTARGLTYLRKLQNERVTSGQLLEALTKRLKKGQKGDVKEEVLDRRMTSLLGAERMMDRTQSKDVLVDKETGELDDSLNTLPDTEKDTAGWLEENLQITEFRRAWDQMNPVWQQLLTLLYGLENEIQKVDEQDLPTLSEVGQKLGVSGQTIWVWRKKALDYLRQTLKETGSVD